MQHQEAIRVIRKLGPELTKEAAESVLLRYATGEDLAPAQLEKLAQSYNMVRQLSHIDVAGDRGSSCHQIDTPALVKSYVTADTHKAAAAGPVAVESHDSGTIDLMLELNREMNPVVKAASSEQPGEIEISHPEVPAPSPEADVRFTPEQLKEAAWEAKVDFYMIADEVLKMAKCEGRVLQTAQAELDASRQINPVCVSEALNWLEKYAGQQRLSRELSRHEGPIKEAAFHLTSPLADKIVELTSAFVVTSLFHKVAAETGTHIDDMPNSDKVNASADPMADLDKMFDEHGVDTPAPDGSSKPINRPPDDERPPKGDDGGKEKKKGKGSSESKSEKSDEQSKGKWLAAIIAGATKPVGAVAGTVNAAASGAQGAVKAVTDKERVHSDQVTLDGDIKDIQRSILIRRLAASDPVLKDMPLRDVLDTYNAIAESNPEAASNPRRVLLAMREAASYEGITLDAQKQLGDVRGAAAKTEAQEDDNTRRRYTA